MIEVVYNKETEENHEAVILPKNIRQVGQNIGTRKIYIEDYAYNYIREYKDDGKPCMGVLLGESKAKGRERYLFIKGAMRIQEMSSLGEQLNFSEEMWDKIYEGMRKYFPESGIVGWYVIDSDWTEEKKEKIRKIHMDHFAGNEKTVLFADRGEGKNTFFVYENNGLQSLDGFLIYYEKNEAMQNFLIDMRSGTRIEEEGGEREKGNFRKLLKEAAVDEVPVKRAFLGYVANGAMIVMILFIGMYMVSSHEKISNLDGTVAGISMEVANYETQELPLQTIETVPIMEISGNVHPLVTEAYSVNGEISVETGEVSIEQEATSELQTATVNAEVKSYQTYEIKKGETLISLSKKFYGDASMINTIMEINDIKNRDQIFEGQIIKLP